MREPEAELDRQRFVQAVFVPDLLHDGLRRVGGHDGVHRVARGDVHQHEAHQADRQRDRDRVEDPAGEIVDHAALRSASAAGRARGCSARRGRAPGCAARGRRRGTRPRLPGSAARRRSPAAGARGWAARRGWSSSRTPRDAAMHGGAEQALRVGVQRRAHQGADRALLDEAAGVHHRDPVGDLAGDAEVVGHEDHAHAHLLLELAQQQQDLDLHGRVERRRGLVGQQQLRAAGQGDGDHRALAQAAGQLVRIGGQAALGGRDLHQLQQLQRAAVGVGCG